MTVVLYSNVNMKGIVFSKPFKQDRMYRVAVLPRMLIQSPELICKTSLLDDGETVARVTFESGDEFSEWIRSFERKVVYHAKNNKETLFKDEHIPNELIEASFVSSLASGNSITMRLSKDVVVYDEHKQVVSPGDISPGTPVVMIFSPTFIDFGKKNFTTRWNVTAIKVAKSSTPCNIVDDN